jgi:hypothetical protein
MSVRFFLPVYVWVDRREHIYSNSRRPLLMSALGGMMKIGTTNLDYSEYTVARQFF